MYPNSDPGMFWVAFYGCLLAEVIPVPIEVPLSRKVRETLLHKHNRENELVSKVGCILYLTVYVHVNFRMQEVSRSASCWAAVVWRLLSLVKCVLKDFQRRLMEKLCNLKVCFFWPLIMVTITISVGRFDGRLYACFYRMA